MELDGQIEVTGNSATYSFSGVGTGISGYICKLDGVVLPDCMFFCVVNIMITLTPIMHRFRSTDWTQSWVTPTEGGSCGVQH